MALSNEKKLISEGELGAIVPFVHTNEIVQRAGNFTALEYIKEFVKFLYVRTGFRFENFTCPKHLERLADQLSFNKVPMRIWHGVMASALRIINTCNTSIKHGARHFGAFFVDVTVWLSKRLVNMGLMRLTIFLFSWCINPVVRIALSSLNFFISWLLDPLWNALSEFIQSRLITAPYYSQFVTMG